jgi:diguanylate cyclase (GGDEF)-like protein/PAS domain S-box-containing protein
MLYLEVANSELHAAIAFLLVCVSAACGGVLLVFWLSRRRAARLKKLSVVAQNWARGDWGERAGVSGHDELARLSGTLDRLADYVQARLGDMECKAGTMAEQAALLDLAHDAILGWDLQTGAIRFWNRGAEELYGCTRAEALGRTPQAVLQTEFPAPLAKINAELIRTRRWEGELVHTRQNGTKVVVASRWALQDDKDGRAVAVLGINSDVTERKQAEVALEHQALHDGLTGLPNRTLFNDRLEHALAHASREGQSVAVLFLDLDNFKVVNDSFGHEVGDTLLVEVAQRLRACLRASDTVARLGGDEFTLLVEEDVDEPAAERLAERIAGALRAPVRVADHDIVVSASIGIALSTPLQSRPATLLRKADTAMYQAKTAGKARYSVFGSGLNKLATERLEMEADLPHAIEHDQLRLICQTISSPSDGDTAEFEALVRATGHDLVPHTSSIPVTDDLGWSFWWVSTSSS